MAVKKSAIAELASRQKKTPREEERKREGELGAEREEVTLQKYEGTPKRLM